MTKIVYWNINKFGANKVQDSKYVTHSATRLMYIEYILAANMPDIFVIVEVCAGRQGEGRDGRLNDNGGAQGAIDLLDYFRSRFGDHWCLVPTLYTGTRGYEESVAVFYNSTNLMFVGPDVWDGQQAVTPTPENRQKATAYTDTMWEGTLPNNEITVVCPTQGLNESQVAGKVTWINNENEEAMYVDFPNPENRKPLLTQFYDRNADRMIRVFSVHTSPGALTAGEGVDQMNNIEEIFMESPANTVDVIVGDFNVDTFNAFDLPNEENPYYHLMKHNEFVMAFPPFLTEDAANLDNIATDDDLIPYRLTHLLSCNWEKLSGKATPFNAEGAAEDDATHNVPPRLGYMGNTGGKNYQVPNSSGAIDNIFTRYGAAAGGPAKKPTIINTTVGSPYANEPDVERDRGFKYKVTLANKLPDIGYKDTGTAQSKRMLKQFRDWNNYGEIYNTSDHVPLIIDI
ncbi:MAG: hypothetical protein Q7V63_09835 [Gammaproteobacteria bacterium]|nr:hypothetical protein [Gammaproteobacteria bacterium]